MGNKRYLPVAYIICLTIQVEIPVLRNGDFVFLFHNLRKSLLLLCNILLNIILHFKRFSGIEKVHRNSIKITVDLWRRWRDLNSRYGFAVLPHFECGPFSHLGTSPDAFRAFL